MSDFESIGQQIITESPEPLTCIDDCPFGVETQTVCAQGPMVRAEVTALAYLPDREEPVLLITPVARLCMREISSRAPQPMPPTPQ